MQYVMYDANYITYWKVETVGQCKDHWLPGISGREQGITRWSTANFQGSEIILQDSVMVNRRHYAFVKTYRPVPDKE